MSHYCPVSTHSGLPDDVALNILRLIVHVLSKLESANKMHFARSYVKYCFDAAKIPREGAQDSLKTVHEEIMRHLPAFLLKDAAADNTLLAALLKHLWLVDQKTEKGWTYTPLGCSFR